MKRLHILSIRKDVSDALHELCDVIFGDQIIITSGNTGAKRGKSSPDLVLLSADFLYADARKMFPDCEIIVPEREIGFANIEKLLAIERGTDVLVVNQHRYSAETVVQSLVNFGIDHLSYHPYYPGCADPPDRIRIAISPSMTHLCPSHITERIDIGPRGFTFQSLCEIVDKLEVDRSALNRYFYHYYKGITNISYKLNEAYQLTSAHQRSYERLFHQLADGIVTVDAEGSVVYLNDAAKKLSAAIALSSPISDYLKTADGKPAALSEIIGNHHDILRVGEKEVVVESFQTNPSENGETTIIIKEVSRVQRLEEDIRRVKLIDGYRAKYRFADIQGNDRRMQRVKEIAQKIARNDLTVLITGETGTGKELFAQAIHNESNRRSWNFVPVNIASLPDSLVESELFGYAEGSFTGARKGGREGLFEKAHLGSIFIDEIGDISLSAQSSILRVLQEKEIMRIGDQKIISVDVRVIAATNKDLRALVEQGRFREDLYYRLNTLPITLPPLRERGADLQELIFDLLRDQNPKLRLSPEVLDIFLRYPWPGNVRELRSAIQYISIIAESEVVTREDLPNHLKQRTEPRASALIRTLAGTDDGLRKDALSDSLRVRLLEIMEAGESRGISYSQKQLYAALRDCGIPVTVHRLNQELREMQCDGVITIGTTKQGTRMTSRGKEYLYQSGNNQR